MHIPDLSHNCYLSSGKSLRAIGWLEGNHSFTKGPVGELAIERLREHLQQPFVNIDSCGSHRCSLCESPAAPEGNGELIVPSEKLCFVAPTLISHYVEVHRYQPPAEFIQALLACPPQGSPSYMKLLNPFIGELSSAA